MGELEECSFTLSCLSGLIRRQATSYFACIGLGRTGSLKETLSLVCLWLWKPTRACWCIFRGWLCKMYYYFCKWFGLFCLPRALLYPSTPSFACKPFAEESPQKSPCSPKPCCSCGQGVSSSYVYQLYWWIFSGHFVEFSWLSQGSSFQS